MWREKNSKNPERCLSQRELRIGLKRLRAGLTHDELDKLINSLSNETISAGEFQKMIVEGARKLETARAFRMMRL